MQGRLADAIAAQLEAINQAVRTGQLTATDAHQLGVMLFAAKDFSGALTAFGQARRLDPAHPGLALNTGMCLLLAGHPREALAELLAAEQALVGPPPPALLDALAHACGKLGDLPRARAYGERSLQAKDAAAGPSLPVAARPLNPAGQRVIAFSLFGALPRYLDGALANARLAPALYPGWRSRFYLDDTVPAASVAALQAAGAEIVHRPRPDRPADALFWRFLVAEDPGVSQFLVRDADSVINPREQAAVAEWLASGRPFHLMRDHPAHTDLMLAGLWGGTAGWLPPLAALLEGFTYRPATESRSVDQIFLGQRVWPRIRGHCLIHDSVFHLFGAKPFPPGSELPPGRHVGDNAAAFGRQQA